MRESNPKWKVELGSIDISDRVLNIRTDRKASDYPKVGETRTGTCSFDVRDPVGEFATTKDNNWWTQNSFDSEGIGTTVKITVGTTVIFTGVVASVAQNVTRGVVPIKCDDNHRTLREASVTDFGLEKSFRLWQDPSDKRNGIYPFRAGVAPFSDDSVSIEKASGSDVDIVDSLSDTGVDPNNVEIRDTEAVSEGAAIPVASGSTYPQLTGKSPYRWIEADDAVKKILQDAGITNSVIQVPPRTTDAHNTRLGRPGYEDVLGKIGASKYLNWGGSVTGALLDGNYLYLAYSCGRDRDYFSRILRYDKRDNSWEDYFRLNTGKREIFGLTKLGDHLVYIASDARVTSVQDRTPTEGSYESAVATADRKCLIQSVDTTASTLAETDLVPKNSDYPVQLGVFYQFGSGTPFSFARRDFIKPDTRRPLLVRSSKLYYYYAKKTTTGIECGVASVAIAGTPSREVYHACGEENHLGGNFAIVGSTLYFANTFLTQTATQQKSRVQVVSCAL